MRYSSAPPPQPAYGGNSGAHAHTQRLGIGTVVAMLGALTTAVAAFGPWLQLTGSASQLTALRQQGVPEQFSAFAHENSLAPMSLLPLASAVVVLALLIAGLVPAAARRYRHTGTVVALVATFGLLVTGSVLVGEHTLFFSSDLNSELQAPRASMITLSFGWGAVTSCVGCLVTFLAALAHALSLGPDALAPVSVIGNEAGAPGTPGSAAANLPADATRSLPLDTASYPGRPTPGLPGSEQNPAAPDPATQGPATQVLPAIPSQPSPQPSWSPVSARPAGGHAGAAAQGPAAQGPAAQGPAAQGPAAQGPGSPGMAPGHGSDATQMVPVIVDSGASPTSPVPAPHAGTPSAPQSAPQSAPPGFDAGAPVWSPYGPGARHGENPVTGSPSGPVTGPNSAPPSAPPTSPVPASAAPRPDPTEQIPPEN